MERWIESTIYRIESVPFGIITLDEMERCSTNGAVDRIHNLCIDAQRKERLKNGERVVVPVNPN